MLGSTLNTILNTFKCESSHLLWTTAYIWIFVFQASVAQRREVTDWVQSSEHKQTLNVDENNPT